MTAQTISRANDRETSEPPSVLLVEDEPTLLNVLRRNLETRQYRVRAVTTARGAIDAVKASLPDLMVLDINLPDGSGWDVLRALRERSAPHVPTVVVSAIRCSAARLDEFHPEAYLPKPFPLSALLETVERLTQSTEEQPAPPVPESAQPPQPMSHAYAQALCDMVEDPRSGVTGIRVVGARSRTVRRLEALARERGLETSGGDGPEDRSWVRIARNQIGEMGEE